MTYVSLITRRGPWLALLAVCALYGTASAQSLPAPWTAGDVGSPSLAGSASASSGVFTVSGAGADIWGSSDQFMFVYQRIAGDADLAVRVDSLTGSSSYAKAGVMIRASLDASAAHAYSHVTRGAGVRAVRRLSAGGSTLVRSGASTGAPVWVRVARVGARVTTYWSTTGASWTQISSETLPLGASAYVGIAVNSRSTGSRATARVSDVRLTGQAAGTALPAGQQAQDIGAPAVAGSVTYASGRYTITAAGSNIGSTADQFHFVYRPMSGNGEIVARVASLVNTNSSAKAGVMMRESLTGDSRHASMMIMPSSGYTFRRRHDPAAVGVNTAGGAGVPPGWVRLVRRGDLFEAYRSTNGTTWTLVGSDTVQMGDTLYVGLAVTSRNTATATSAVIDTLSIVEAQPGTNAAPAVSITSPSTGASATLPTTMTISAAAVDPENRMASVDFYAGTTMILRDTTAPYAATWSPSTAGTYALTAVAHDADGGSTTSSVVNVTVQDAANRAPSVSLSASGTYLTAPATCTLTASASDPEGQLSRVEFFNGSTRLSSDTTAPYSYSWSGLAAGTYVLTAVAYDAAGASASSSAVTVTVGAAPAVPTTVSFTASSDHAANVTSYVMKVYAAGANTATATPIATSDLGKPAPGTNAEITVNRATFFSGLAAGSYIATVTAVGPGGQTPSASVAFTR